MIDVAHLTEIPIQKEQIVVSAAHVACQSQVPRARLIDDFALNEGGVEILH